VARRYATRKVILRAQVVFAAVIVLAWVLLISEHAASVFLAIVVIATLLTIWQGIEGVRNAGVRETPDGITNYLMFGYRRSWRWEEIEKFAHVRSHVYVVTQDRHISQLAGVNQGWLNTWEGGETREITALLNERLAFWRSKRYPAVPELSHT
jgi:hypothetical protein